MVETKLDPIRVPTLNLNAEELADMQAKIDAGELPRDFMDRHFEAVDRNVFGFDAKTDRKGNFIEQGIGAAINQTRNSVEAYRKYGKAEPGYEETLKRMESELAKCEAERAAKNPIARRRRRVA